MVLASLQQDAPTSCSAADRLPLSSCAFPLGQDSRGAGASSSFLVCLCKEWTVLNSSADCFPTGWILLMRLVSRLCFLPCHFPGLRGLPHPWDLCHSCRFWSLAKHTVTMIYDLGLFVVIWEAEKTNAHVPFGQKNEHPIRP